MPHRDLYLAAYDISHDRRRTAALALVRGYTTGGQKSVHEVFLSRGERQELLHTMALLLNEAEDRFFLLRLDPRARSYALGVAAQPADPEYFYVG
ncbi:CRISPR-associated endonuclease Cas2 [Thauera butanivorans]|uniref:CRISPR-associated endonuclease Cas2 n=1 Tax=Thauera butanivorans TaxID=86174 RepID=UPI0008382333|nr:CRISPR-associated endonuclease Cas2 [Thauera butanivorans]